MSIKIGIIGGGAAGFFAAITAAETNPKSQITILEKTGKLLSKVKISGGGRCNVTNGTFENYKLSKNYPRGSKELSKAFEKFGVKDTFEWFQSRGVKLKTEEDGRVFPVTNDSQTIIDCFLKSANRAGITIKTGYGVTEIQKVQQGIELTSQNGEKIIFDKVLISSGGNPTLEAYDWILKTEHTIIEPVPSLFTFNIPESKFKGLQGIASEKAQVKITGIKSSQEGPVLITHWGLSGPAVLKLSAWEARRLKELNYRFEILINWIPGNEEESLREHFNSLRKEYAKKQIYSNPLFSIPKRLWEQFCEQATIEPDRKWMDVSQKSINKLIEELIRSHLTVNGKTTFKEEFVTCGGIDLKEVNFETMESKKHPGIYFAGEVLNIDGITGGYNFQAAWTTGYIAGKAMANEK